MPYNPLEYATEFAQFVNRGCWRRANKVRVWGSGYDGVATADMIGCILYKKKRFREGANQTNHKNTPLHPKEA